MTQDKSKKSGDNGDNASNDNSSITVKFSDLALSSEVQKAVDSVGYETPSPIQAQAIPHLLEGRDILGVAQTGTGKTAAFALPLLSTINTKAKLPQVLCLAPTRELAIQVAEAFQTYAKHIKGFKVLPIYGGTDYRGQIRQLERGVQVVVGTPGRVMDHMRKGTLKLNDLKALVLDEADEMLRMGFIDDVEWILEQTPEQHQTALFSATMPPQIKKLTKKYLDKPAEITIKQKTTTAPGIHQRYILLKNNDKLDTLTRIMEVEEIEAMIIFVRTKNATVEVSERLQARGYAATALNGDIAQSQREKTVARLKKGSLDIIVATDVAARGLDVERVSHVLNYDVPYDTESYVHRIGRTGRAGRDGDAILFLNGREKNMLRAIEKTTRQKIEPFKFPSVSALNDKKIEQIFTRIDTELQKDLSEYTSVINKYMAHNEDADPLTLAAAFASLEGDSQPFFLKEVINAERSKGPQIDRGDYTSYKLEVGESHGVSKKDIVGAIANEAGIDSKNMGKIRIYKEHAFIELPVNLSEDDIKTLKRLSIRGQKANISEDTGGGKREGGRRPRRDSSKGDRPRGDKYRDKKPGSRKPKSKKSNDSASAGGDDKKPKKKPSKKKKEKAKKRKSNGPSKIASE